MTPTDWRVEFGDRRQFRAWFDDQAHAVDFAARHGGVVVPLVAVTASSSSQNTAPADPQSSAGTA